MKTKKCLRSRVLAVILVIAMLVTPMATTVQAKGFLDTIGKIAPVFTAVNGALTFAGSVYDGAVCAAEADEGERFVAFMQGLIGRGDPETEDPVLTGLTGIKGSLDKVDGKLDNISASIAELSPKLDTIVSKLNEVESIAGDIKVTLHQNQLQMQNWQSTKTQIDNFYNKYSDVRRTLETTISTLSTRSDEFAEFLDTLSDEARGALEKITVTGDTSALSADELTLVNEQVEFKGGSYNILDYANDYNNYMFSTLKKIYDKFASGYSTDMYMTLQNMADFILGEKWQNNGNGGIGEIYYKLMVMTNSNSDQVHASYRSFSADVQYDFLLTAYVCSLALKSQIAMNTQSGTNFAETATFKSYLNTITELIVQVLEYSDYEYEKCKLNYDFDGVVPENGLSYDDYITYYGNPTNALNMNITKNQVISKKAKSAEGTVEVTNQELILSVGETDQINVWHNGKKMQTEFNLASNNNCVRVNADGSVIGVYPGTAEIRILAGNNLYTVAKVTVRTAVATPNGTANNEYVYYKDGIRKTYSVIGNGYTNVYNPNISTVENGIDSSKNKAVRLSDCVQLEGTTLNDYTVSLYHKYGKLISEEGNYSLLFSQAYTGCVLLDRTVDGTTYVVTVPITNTAKTPVPMSEISYSTEAEREDDPDTVYIHNKQELLDWKAKYDTGFSTPKKNVKLMADIDMAGEKWSGIKYALIYKTFEDGWYSYPTTPDDPKYKQVRTYTFDGNGHTIKNLTFVATENEIENITYKEGAEKTLENIEDISKMKVLTYGFFSKLAGKLTNLTIENVAYDFIDPFISSSDQYYNSYKIESVFASLAYSKEILHTHLYSSEPNYPEHVIITFAATDIVEWESEISNCVVTGTCVGSEQTPFEYDPFGNFVDHERNTMQEIDVKNNIYALDYKHIMSGFYRPDYEWKSTRYTIFNTGNPNLYIGNTQIALLNKYETSLVGKNLTEEQKQAAKKNIRMISKDSYPNANDYLMTQFEISDPSFWTSRGWSLGGLEQMFDGKNFANSQKELFIDTSAMKQVYFVGEELDLDKLVAINRNGERVRVQLVSAIDTSTPGTKTVTVKYDRYGTAYNYTLASFEVKYVAIEKQYFEYGGTSYSRWGVVGESLTMPEALFTNPDPVYFPVGWYVKGNETGNPIPFGGSFQVTGSTTFVPAWKIGETRTVTFRGAKLENGQWVDLVYQVPEGTVIIVPEYPEVDEYSQARSWINGRPFSSDAIHVKPGTQYTVSKDITFKLEIDRKPIMVTYTFYYQNIEDDEYTLLGTKAADGNTLMGVGELGGAYTAFYNLTREIYGSSRQEDFVKFEYENFVVSGNIYKPRPDGSSYCTVWVNRRSYTINWNNAEGKTIKTEQLRTGAMPTPPTEGVVEPGYVPIWDYEIKPVKYGMTYTVIGQEPAPNVSYKVNHLWQNVEDDDYILHESEDLTGTTGLQTNAAAKNYQGFTAKAFTQNTIAGDGSTVIDIYYDRNEYTVTWDVEGVTSSEQYRFGATPTYKGETPAKPADAQYTYTFKGFGNIVSVEDHVTYTAQFTPNLNSYTIHWNVDGKITDETYTYGETPSFKGETPTKPANAQYTYTFRDFGTITPVTGEKTYTAQFDAVLNKYTVTWNVEGETIKEQYYYGETPVYKGVKPVKAPDESGSYRFKDWGEILPVTGDVTYTAVFVPVASSYTITWDVNGEKISEIYTYGETPVYKGATPQKPADAQYSYTFAGWGEITAVTGNKTYTAQFDRTRNQYKIIWNIDGKQTVEWYEYGATPSYKGATPVREADVQYSYTFKDWGNIAEVNGNKTYTATFNATVNKYNITWKINGVSFTETYEYGQTPVYKSTTPAKPADAQYSYIFAGWGEITKVTGNKTYVAAFDKVVNTYTVTWIVNGAETTETYEYGAVPSFKGETPKRPADVKYTYTFKDFGEIVPVTGNKTYTAIFDAKINKYTVTWDIDGVQVEEQFEYGVIPKFSGETPARPSTAQYSYIFVGWGSVTEVTGDTTYTAVFEEKVNKYTVTWNIDGKTVTEEYAYGETPRYKGEDPAKASTESTVYFFESWGEITPVTGDKTYTAKFMEVTRKYTVTWIIDGVKITETYAYGDMPKYKDKAPEKASTAQYSYTFVGWGKTEVVTADQTYVAQFEESIRKYTITWNADGYLTTEEYEYGKMPGFKGSTPTKTADAQYTYTFTGWGDITAVDADKTYTAVFSKTLNKYTITWVVNDQSFAEEYEYGATPVYKGYKPEKEATKQYAYTFAGWGDIVKVTENKTYTALFHAEYIVPTEVTSSSLNVTGNSISKIQAGTSSKEFLAALSQATYCKVFDGNTPVSNDAPIGTGMTVKLMDGSKVLSEYTAIVTGDSTGDGKITITDMLAVKAHILNKTPLKGAYATAADTNGDGTISVTDFLQEKAHVLGKSQIVAK